MGLATPIRVWCGLLLWAWTLLTPAVVWSEESPQYLEQSRLLIQSGDRRFEFQVELATTPGERRRGLMFRQELAPDRGMLFDFNRTTPISMWMRNTYISLDMLFIRADGKIANIARDTEPFSEAILSSDGPVRAVLEVPAGTTLLLGIQPGDRVLHPVFGDAIDR